MCRKYSEIYHWWSHGGIWGIHTSPLFKDMGLIIRPNLHRNTDGGRGVGRIEENAYTASKPLMKNSILGATRYHVLRWGYTPNLTRELTALPRPPSCI